MAGQRSLSTVQWQLCLPSLQLASESRVNVCRLTGRIIPIESHYCLLVEQFITFGDFTYTEVNVDINQAFRFVFDDERWTNKILIGVLMSLLSFLILPAFILSGWVLQIVRNVMSGVKRPLAEWDDWGKMLRDGFNLFIAQLVYGLPLIILMIIFLALSGGFAAFSDSSSDAAAAGLTVTALLFTCIAFIYGILLLFLTPAITIQYAMTDELSATFRFSEVFAIAREHFADILISVVVIVVAAVLFSMVTGVLSLIPCLGWIAAVVLGLAFGPYIAAVTGHLYGQIGTKVQGPGKMPPIEEPVM